MRVIALLCGLVATTMVAFGTNASAQVDPGGEVSRQQYDAWMSELSNWGRWGADDQLGALLHHPRLQNALFAFTSDHGDALEIRDTSVLRFIELIEQRDASVFPKQRIYLAG